MGDRKRKSQYGTWAPVDMTREMPAKKMPGFVKMTIMESGNITINIPIFVRNKLGKDGMVQADTVGNRIGIFKFSKKAGVKGINLTTGGVTIKKAMKEMPCINLKTLCSGKLPKRYNVPIEWSDPPGAMILYVQEMKQIEYVKKGEK